MGQTSNYGLKQWESWERVTRGEVNELVGGVDAAVKAAYQLADGKASAVFGTYTANGQASQHINLGFSPRALILCTRAGLLFPPTQPSFRVAGIIFPQMDFEEIYLTDTGFTVRKLENMNAYSPNSSEYSPYYYIAFQ